MLWKTGNEESIRSGGTWKHTPLKKKGRNREEVTDPPENSRLGRVGCEVLGVYQRREGGGGKEGSGLQGANGERGQDVIQNGHKEKEKTMSSTRNTDVLLWCSATKSRKGRDGMKCRVTGGESDEEGGRRRS